MSIAVVRDELVNHALIRAFCHSDRMLVSFMQAIASLSFYFERKETSALPDLNSVSPLPI
mgnify:CR=1 FL=1